MNWVIIGSGNGLSPVRRQAITWTNADLLSIRPLGTNFSVIRIKIQNFSFTKMHLKLSSAKWRPFCPGGDELKSPRGKYIHTGWQQQLYSGYIQAKILTRSHAMCFISQHRCWFFTLWSWLKWNWKCKMNSKLESWLSELKYPTRHGQTDRMTHSLTVWDFKQNGYYFAGENVHLELEIHKLVNSGQKK